MSEKEYLNKVYKKVSDYIFVYDELLKDVTKKIDFIEEYSSCSDEKLLLEKALYTVFLERLKAIEVILDIGVDLNN